MWLVNWGGFLMKSANPQFLMFMMELYQRTDLKPIETIVYSLMLNTYRYYKKSHIEFSPSIKYLAKESKFSELTVKNALQTLKKLGLITVLKRGNGITGKASTYTVQYYRELKTLFTRPSTSDISKADREARSDADIPATDSAD
ncbi:Uncharacterised protein [Enterobacter hormaechei]|nr:hypothetical protein L384_02895 [Enterobacter sp. MGH 38]CZX28023.1 Uncharacterised protein [Enterobacter hormaechei]CZX43436.1 Uncharacterised protein [Enterobacter hormaechei]VAE13217.1 Uncharacterised protein [Enterobacter hormaechei]VAF57058.1 Uncharacterised protein [Enterobacter hormaechei]